MTMNQILEVLTAIVPIEKELAEAGAKVEVAKGLLAKASSYEAAICRGRVRDAENAARDVSERLDALLARIPPSEEVPMAWTLRYCAEKMAARAALEMRLDRAEEKLSELDAIKTFRAKKAGTSPEVATATAVRDKLLEEIRDLSVAIAEWKVFIDQHDAMMHDLAESDAWAAGEYKGPMPEGVRRVLEAHQAELDKVLEPLPPLRKRSRA
jgi:chromosome segregation ATPase